MPLKDALVANFSERQAPVSRKYVAGQGMNILKSSEKHKSLWSYSSVFALQWLFTSKRPLVTTLSETHTLTSRKYAAEDTNSNPKQFKPYELLWLHSSVFALQF